MNFIVNKPLELLEANSRGKVNIEPLQNIVELSAVKLDPKRLNHRFKLNWTQLAVAVHVELIEERLLETHIVCPVAHAEQESLT